MYSVQFFCDGIPYRMLGFTNRIIRPFPEEVSLEEAHVYAAEQASIEYRFFPHMGVLTWLICQE